MKNRTAAKDRINWIGLITAVSVLILGSGLDQHQNAITAARATAEAKLAASLS